MAISFKDLVLGEPLRWNPFSKGGGKTQATPAPVPAPEPQPAPPPEPEESDGPPSVLHKLNLCNRRLDRLLQNLRNEHNAEAEVRNIARSVIAAVDLDADIALACIFLSQIAGTYAVRHCIETAIVGIVIARAMGRPESEILTVTAAALTMNVGMLRHQETFQNKCAPLSSEEMAIVRRHPEDSADILKTAGIEDEEWISCVLLHHENDAGTGYPSGIASPEVTKNAKLLSMADRYCAQVAARNYRCSVLPNEALHNLLSDAHIPTDADLAAQFTRELGDYPPGCLVRLQNGEIGVITKRGDAAGVLSMQCLRDTAGNPLSPAVARQTSEHGCGIAEAVSEDQASIRFGMKQIWGELASL